jgi:hypothetical protein
MPVIPALRRPAWSTKNQPFHYKKKNKKNQLWVSGALDQLLFRMGQKHRFKDLPFFGSSELRGLEYQQGCWEGE